MFKRTKVCTGVLIALSGAAGITALPAYAQQTLERVEITGSSIRRVDAETALPVTVISAQELQRQGINTAEQALSRIASNQSNFGVTQSVGGTTGAKAEADLRGLSGPSASNANKTLVLLNGRRLVNHSFDAAAVDLNAIPMAAVSRVEILRDGASAIYGTDAIGGVINFILRRDYTGLEVSAEGQKPQRSGGGDTQRFNIVGGFGSLAEQGFNVMATIDWRQQNALKAADRRFSRTGIVGTTRGAIGSGTSGTSFPGDLNGFEPSGPNCAPPTSVPRNTNPDNSGPFESCRYDFSSQVDAIPQNEQLTALVRGSVALGTELTMSAEYLRANNKATARVAAVPQNHLMPTSSPFFPTGATPTTGGIPDINNPDGPNVPGGVANWRSVPGGKRTSADDTTTERGLVELEGLVAGWDLRTAVGVSRNKSTASVKRGYLDDDLMQQGVFDGVINPFGPQTAAGQAAIDAAQLSADTLLGRNKMTFVDARISRELMQLSAGPLSAAFGVEYRRDNWSYVATDINAVLINSLGIDPDSDAAGKRNAQAIFAEFNIPITKTLEAQLAGRYDRYSDFGNSFNPKVGLRWQPTRAMVFRSSYNTGFRAPTLFDIYQPAALSFTSDSYNDPLLCPNGTPVGGASAGTVCDQQTLKREIGPVANGTGRSFLKPEESKTLTFGGAFELSRNLTVSADFWTIRIDKIISPVPEQEIFANPTKYASRFVRCSQLSPAERANVDVCLNYPSFDPIAYIDAPTENLGQLNTRGLDLSAAFRSDATSYGRFGLAIDGTYVIAYKYQREIGGPMISAVGKYTDAAPIFRWQHVITASWSQGDWAASLVQRYKSSYTDQGGERRVSPQDLYDVALSWTGVKNLTVGAAIKNVFDRDPPKSIQNNTFQRGYDPRFSDPLGRTFVVQANYKFF